MGVATETMAQTHSESYWEGEYGKGTETFDWYQQPAHMDSVLAQIKSGQTALVTGCGTSDLPATLAAKGVVVHACDFANSAIAAMKGRAGNVTFTLRMSQPCPASIPRA